MTRSGLINRMAEHKGITQKQSETVVIAVFKAMAGALEAGIPVKIRCFGSFSVKNYKPFDGRNPKTGAPFKVKAKRCPVFKASESTIRPLERGVVDGYVSGAFPGSESA